jgi:putative oxidoreductase
MLTGRIHDNDIRFITLACRQLFAVIFIIASAGHFSPGTIASAGAQGVPIPGLLVPVSGVIALLGGLSVLFGYRARLGAWLLMLFLVPVTLTMHDFWAMSDPTMFYVQLTSFTRNLMLLGGALCLAYRGAGPLSLDALIATRARDGAAAMQPFETEAGLPGDLSTTFADQRV